MPKMIALLFIMLINAPVNVEPMGDVGNIRTGVQLTVLTQSQLLFI